MSELTKEVSATEIPTGSIVDEISLKKAQEEYDTFKNSLKDKLYGLKVEDQATVDQIVDFINNKAEWKAMEALGIEQLSKRLAETKIKSNHIFLGSLEVDALHFFLGKVSGTGLDSAKSYLKMIRAVNEALRTIKADNLQIQKLEGTLEAIRNGIKVDTSAEKQEEAKS